jgi:hypothetical protein
VQKKSLEVLNHGVTQNLESVALGEKPTSRDGSDAWSHADSELVCDGYGVDKVVHTHKIMGQGSRAPRPIEYVGAGIWAG